MKFAPSYRSVVATAVISGVFSVIVCVTLTFGFLGWHTSLALDDPQYLKLHQQLAVEAGDIDLQAQLRALDFRLRQRYFRWLTFARRGAYLLAAGAVTTLLLVHWASTIRRRLPTPKPAAGPDESETRQSQLAQVAAVALVVVVASFVFASRRTSLNVLPDSPTAWGEAARPNVITSLVDSSDKASASLDPTSLDRPPAGPSGELVAPVTSEQLAANWHRFRGPQGAGVAAFTDVPETWDGAGGQGVLWKTAVELPGVSSPIVWGDRIFLTGATSERREVYCFAAADGELLWRKLVAEKNDPPKAEIEVDRSTGFAAPTPTTDGRHVYALFASGDLVALDFAGNAVWTHDFGVLGNPYGHASSLDIYRDLLILQLDQGSRSNDRSKLLAVRAATGDLVWETARPVGASWSSPIVVEHEGQPRIITCAEPWVIAYDAAEGREIWRADCLSGDVAPSAVYADGVAYVANDMAVVAAIRDGGTGDVTDSHILWWAEFGLPDICSPLVTPRHVLLVASYGALVCYDREQGGEEPMWEEDLGAIVMASPSLVGDRVYLIGEEGQGWVVRPHDSGVERIAENDLGERCFTSPAFQQGRIYIRGEQHLFCLGNQPAHN